jgi:hypothetical protein
MESPSKMQKLHDSRKTLEGVSDIGLMDFLDPFGRSRINIASQTVNADAGRCVPTTSRFLVPKDAMEKNNHGCPEYMSEFKESIETREGYARCCSFVSRQDTLFIETLIFCHSRVIHSGVMKDLFPEIDHWIEKRSNHVSEPEFNELRLDQTVIGAGIYNFETLSYSKGYTAYTMTIDPGVSWYKIFMQYILLALPDFKIVRKGPRDSQGYVLCDHDIRWNITKGVTDDLLEMIQEFGTDGYINYQTGDTNEIVKPFPMKSTTVKYNNNRCDITTIGQVIRDKNSGLGDTERLFLNMGVINAFASWDRVCEDIFLAMESKTTMKTIEIVVGFVQNTAVHGTGYVGIPFSTSDTFEADMNVIMNNITSNMPGGAWRLSYQTQHYRFDGQFIIMPTSPSISVFKYVLSIRDSDMVIEFSKKEI